MSSVCESTTDETQEKCLVNWDDHGKSSQYFVN